MDGGEARGRKRNSKTMKAIGKRRRRRRGAAAMGCCQLGSGSWEGGQGEFL